VEERREGAEFATHAVALLRSDQRRHVAGAALQRRRSAREPPLLVRIPPARRPGHQPVPQPHRRAGAPQRRRQRNCADTIRCEMLF